MKSYGLQSETKQYLRRLYAYGRELAPTDIADVDNFIKGLKQLNLWQNIIAYPLRSQHNIGSASNVLSLGGLGKFDGVAQNSPTWGLSGINFTAASSQYIRIPNFLNSPTVAGFSMICLHQPDFSTTGRALLGNDGASATTRGLRINVQSNSYLTGTGTATRMFVSFSASKTSSGTDAGARFYDNFNTANMHINYVSFGGNLANGLTASIDTTTNTGSIILPFFGNDAYNTMGIGARNGNAGSGDYFQGTMSLMIIANRAITATEYSGVYNLIKTTIGKGLNLP